MPGGEPWFQICPCSVTAFLTWIFEWHQYDSQPYKNHDNFSYPREPLRRPHFSGTGLLKLPTRKVSLPAPQSTSKAIYWLAKNLAQMARNTTFSHYPVISTTKSHSLILWAHQLAEQHEETILGTRLEQRAWRSSSVGLKAPPPQLVHLRAGR